jgi:chloramphenicol-sensitive protein RarD
VVGLAVETTLLMPIAIAYLLWARRGGGLYLGTGDLGVDLLLLAAGIITTAPLLCFTSAARLLPLSTMGFIQYVAPSGHFLLAVLVYGEPLTAAHVVTFGCIWTALAIFSRDQLRRAGPSDERDSPVVQSPVSSRSTAGSRRS